MKNKLLVLLFFMLILLSSKSYCVDLEDEVNEQNYSFIEKQLEKLNINELEELVENIDDDVYNYFPKISLKNFISSIMKGENVTSGKEIFEAICKIILREVKQNASLLINILTLTIVCSILTNLQSAFEKDTVGELAYYICYIVLAILIIKSFLLIMNLGKDTVQNMVDFMQALLPTLLTLLIAVGGVTTNTLFHPMVLGTVNVIGVIVKDIVFPLIFFSFIVGIISKISNKIQFSKLAHLIRQVAVTIIGISLTVFIGMMSIYGVTSKVDGITIKTAKFAVDKFVPIVGKFLSDAMETVVGCSSILKNAVGVMGLFSLFLICVIPILKIIALIFIYKIVIAIIEPISNQKIINCLNEVSKSLSLILASILSTTIMFFITITIIVKAGNVAMMLR